MKRFAFLLYGVVCYLMFLGVFAYAACFVGGFLVPTSLDGPRTSPLWLALLVDVGLIAVFGIQHSVMARPGFKQWWTRFVPKPIERSTYVLITNVLLIALFVLWEPLGGTVWEVQHQAGRAALYTLFGAGWLMVPLATLMTGHFDLFGVRQVWLYFKGEPYTPPDFKTPAFYRYVRHPLYTGFILGFWATPTMTAAHLLFAALMTAYILIAVRFEERDLTTFHGEAYRTYTQRVPMLFPLPGKRLGAGSEAAPRESA